jgi:RNA polymerase sigma factor (sigma-70 family)
MHATTSAADRDAAILSLAPIVCKSARWIARRAAASVFDIDDLESAGWVGAIRAVDNFDPAFGIPLAGYAGRVIVGAMFNELRRNDPVSERDRRTVRVGNRQREALRHKLGREPTLAEVDAASPGFEQALVKCINQQPSSYDAPIEHPDGYLISPTTFLRGDADVEQAVIAHEERTAMREAIGSLERRRQAVINSHYFGERSLHDVAGVMNVSPQRVSQLHLTALDTLQAALDVA